MWNLLGILFYFTLESYFNIPAGKLQDQKIKDPLGLSLNSLSTSVESYLNFSNHFLKAICEMCSYDLEN